MATFRFKLQPLLDLRSREEDACRTTYRTLVGERSRIEHRLLEHQRVIREGRHAMRSGMLGTVDTDALRLQSHAALGLMREAQSAAIALAGLARRIETARGALDVARGRRKAVESLRERRHREWKLLQDRREVAAQDELATIAAFRRERDS